MPAVITGHSQLLLHGFNLLQAGHRAHTETMARDLVGRLRRDSWLVSKRRWFLNLHLETYAAYRNFVRRRFNNDHQTPAQRLGFVDRPLLPTQLLSWRQDWGLESIHPLAHAHESVRTWQPRIPALRS